MKKLLAVLSIALLVVGAVTNRAGANRLSLRRGERSGLLPEF